MSNLSVGRPSAARNQAKLLESLKDSPPAEPMRRINFELADSKVRKLKIAVAKSGHRSVKDFLTAYIDSLPEE
jgi:hypothetical protein